MRALAYSWRMIFVRKPVSTFPDHALALGGAALPIAPLQEFAEQCLTLLVGQGRGGAALVLQEGRELGGRNLRIGGAFRAHALEHLLRHARAGPARNGGGEVDVTPFRVARRLEE